MLLAKTIGLILKSFFVAKRVVLFIFIDLITFFHRKHSKTSQDNIQVDKELGRHSLPKSKGVS